MPGLDGFCACGGSAPGAVCPSGVGAGSDVPGFSALLPGAGQGGGIRFGAVALGVLFGVVGVDPGVGVAAFG